MKQYISPLNRVEIIELHLGYSNNDANISKISIFIQIFSQEFT